MCLMTRMMMKPVRRAHHDARADARALSSLIYVNLWCVRLVSSSLALLDCGARVGSPHGLMINSRSPRENLTHLNRPRRTRRVIPLLLRVTYAEHLVHERFRVHSTCRIVQETLYTPPPRGRFVHSSRTPPPARANRPRTRRPKTRTFRGRLRRRHHLHARACTPRCPRTPSISAPMAAVCARR